MPVDPSTLRVVSYPDPVLRKPTAPITPSDEVRAVARRMIELMHEHNGIGLAAPQVGLPWRLFVTFVPPTDERRLDADPLQADAEARVYLNPVLSEPEGPLEPLEEGCLSLPDVQGAVLRPRSITIDALDENGTPVRRRASGLLARCWQHEFDHLEGVLIIDRMPPIHRMKNRGALRDLEAEYNMSRAPRPGRR
jgi:peptide deformylase